MSGLPVVVVLGAGMGGRGVCDALVGKAHTVVVDRSAEPAQKIVDSVREAGGSGQAAVVDLSDLAAVQRFRDELLEEHGRVDAVVHLVGGWAASADVDAEAIEQFDRLITPVLRSVQTTSVAFREPLRAAAGRYYMVTSTTVVNPTATSAAYASLKAAAERWVAALDASFAGSGAAARVLAVVALADDGVRAANPQKDFSGHTDTRSLGEAVWAGMTGDPGPAYIDLRGA